MANSSKTAKNQPKQRSRGKPFEKGDKRINRKGRPPKDTTLSDAFNDLMDRTTEDAAEILGGSKTELGRFFLLLPKGIKVRYILAGRNITAEIAEPNARRLQEIWNRAEGKVPERIEGTNKPIPVQVIEITKKVEENPEDEA